MNWKDLGNGRYVAWAARAVGGKYEIKRCQSFSHIWGRGSWYFDIRYLYRTGPGAWNDPGINKVGHTLEEAKALAEAHHKQQVERLK